MNTLKRVCFERFAIAGFSYYEGCVVFSKLTIGKKLHLKTEPDNTYDKNAVAIYYKKHKLGFIPRDKNTAIAKLLACGIHVFEARIQRIDASEHTENQIGVIVYVIKES